VRSYDAALPFLEGGAPRAALGSIARIGDEIENRPGLFLDDDRWFGRVPIYALPRTLAPRAGFDPLALREEVLGRSGNVGLLPVVYERG
jgi:hypothetical protein